MALDKDDKEWLTLSMENAALKAHQEHLKNDHAPLEQKILRVSGAAKREARFLAGGGAALLAGWEWIKAHSGGS